MSEVKQKRILVVDDDPGDIGYLKKILNSDYILIEANDGLQALKIAKREHPDLILLDVMMPNTSGYTVCAHLKGNPDTKDIPVVMVTGLGTEINKEIGKELGANGYLVKPVKSDQLRSIISKFIE